jgi:perosamine synthetase
MIRVFEPKITLSDKINIVKSLNKNLISGTSPEIKKFETLYAEKFDMKHAVAVSSGSAALDLAFQNIDLEEGDEVVVPSFTIVSCLSAVIRAGGKPVFCDVDNESWNMRLQDIKKVISSKTKVILMVHTYGLTAEAKEIVDYCSQKNIMIIEDAAEAHGQKYAGKYCGTFGKISTFSFYANKHITTGEGGMLLTNDELIYQKLLRMRNLDFNNSKRFIHNNMYWNFRMSSLQASLGISQMKNLQKVIELKTEQGNNYLELLDSYQNFFQLPIKKMNKVENHFWVFGIVLKEENIRDQLMESLLKERIETRPFFWPLHLQPLLGNSKNKQKLENSEFLGRNGLYLPMGNHINKKIQISIVQKLLKESKTLFR